METLLTLAKQNGLRITRSRRLVAGELSEHPLTAQEIFKRIRNKRKQVDLASVYRTLETFTQLGAVKEVTIGDGYTRFEKAMPGHHHHLVCTICGKVTDIEMNEAPLLKEVRKRTDFSVSRHILEFFGTCAACQKSSAL